MQRTTRSAFNPFARKFVGKVSEIRANIAKMSCFR